MMPKTLQRKNNQLLQNNMSMTGDHNLDLYFKSREHEKSNKQSEEYWYERNKEELTFKPQINKQPPPLNESVQDVREIKGAEKQLERLAKAREDAAWKKKMTERSTFSATKGIKHARKKALQDTEEPDFRVT